jgi:hypothetical protein
MASRCGGPMPTRFSTCCAAPLARNRGAWRRCRAGVGG